MPFARPTLEQLIVRVRTDVEARVGGLSARLRRSFEYGLVRAVAGLAHGLHGHLDWLGIQIIPSPNADMASLIRWGAWAPGGGVTPLSATGAAGLITITGVATTAVPQGTQWTGANGTVYETTAAVTIGSIGEVTATVQALEDTGDETNLEGGTSLSIVTPIVGVDSTALVGAGGLVGGTDDETREAFYARVVDRFSRPVSGGGPGDWVAWALSQSASRAWEMRWWEGVGNVGVAWVYDVREGDAALRVDVPTSAQVTAMQAYLESVAPVGSTPVAIALATTAVNFTMVISPNTAEVQENIRQAIRDLFMRVAEPFDPNDAASGKVLISQINEAISLAQGEVDHTLSSPTVDQQAAAGFILVPGTFTFS